MGAASNVTLLTALRGKRVLLVEDEYFVASMVHDELQDLGAEVLGPTASIEEAMLLIDQALADGRGINAVVLDINLQGRMAVPIADRLAAQRVPFVFATGYSRDIEGYQWNKRVGTHTQVPIVAKPYDPRALAGALVHCMRLGGRAS